jgi:hypothetical protein
MAELATLSAASMLEDEFLRRSDCWPLAVARAASTLEEERERLTLEV